MQIEGKAIKKAEADSRQSKVEVREISTTLWWFIGYWILKISFND
jgi:hypothetical protein